MNPSPRILACSKTDPGLQRPRNEDVCQADIERGFFLVADGMGGRAGGDIASSLFREAVREVFSEGRELEKTEGEVKIRAAFSLANRKILDHVADHPHHSGMGCTAELLVFCRDHYLIGHVGDSRTYLFRGEKIRQLTRDHSFVQDQVDKGIMTPAQAERSRFRSVLLRAVGVDPVLAIDIIGDLYSPGDIFLLCTDGLHTMLGTGAIVSILSFQGPLAKKADMFIDRANEAGGVDNITVTLAEVLG